MTLKIRMHSHLEVILRLGSGGLQDILILAGLSFYHRSSLPPSEAIPLIYLNAFLFTLFSFFPILLCTNYVTQAY